MFFNFLTSILVICCLLLTGEVKSTQLTLAPSYLIHEIEVKGLKKIEKEAIFEKLSVKKGDSFYPARSKAILNSLYALKLFDFIKLEVVSEKEKNTLVISVKERPIIEKIEFEGNQELDNSKLKEVVKSKEFNLLDVASIKKDVTALLKYYETKGFFLAQIDFRLEKINEEARKLIFEIKEREKVRVKKITILGNQAFSDEQLKDVMLTKEEGFFSFLTGSGNFEELMLEVNLERIKYFYKSKGYLQVNTSTAEVTVSPDRRWIFLTFKVQEGPQFTVRNISYKGDLLFTEEELRESTELAESKTYSEDTLRKDIQALTEKYQDKGYAFANVIRSLSVVPGETKVDVEFSFEKGKLAYIGTITIQGNTKTRDKVVRRELLIKEGMLYSGTAMRESKENVTRLGYFDNKLVTFTSSTNKEKDDIVDVLISVKETNTGQISLGAGYSSQSKGFVEASITQNNFRGLGQILSFRVMLSKNEESYLLDFTEPYFLDSKWTTGAGVFRTNSRSSKSLHFQKDGFQLRAGHPLFDYTRFLLTYKFENMQIKHVTDPTVDKDLEKGIASSVEAAITYDKRNNRMRPTKGHYLSFSTEYTGVGGDKKWIRYEADARYFKTIWGDLVLRTRLWGSKMEYVNDRPIPRSALLYIGGPKNLRGYEFESLGPKRTLQIQDSKGILQTKTFNTGSLFATVANVELEHPLIEEAGLNWVVFTDAGHIGDVDQFVLHKNYGFGVRWFSPIGILRFEFAFPIAPKEGTASGQQFYFDIGQIF